MVNVTISGEGHKEVAICLRDMFEAMGLDNYGVSEVSAMQGHSSFLVLWKNQPVTDAEKK